MGQLYFHEKGLVILPDDQRGDHLEVNGCPVLHTPNLCLA